MSINIDLGKIKLEWKGEYSQYSTYEKDDVVRYNNAVYIVLKNVYSVVPSDDGVNYELMVSGIDESTILTSQNATMQVPVALSDFGVGTTHCGSVLMSDRSVRAWGYGSYYGLGNGQPNDEAYPVEMNLINLEADEYVVKVYDFGIFKFLLTNKAQVYANGYNGSGNLGLGNTINAPIPTKVNIKNVIKIVASGANLSNATTAFLTSDGLVYVCGYNGQGQIGNGATVQIDVPTKVEGLLNIKDIYISNAFYPTVFGINTSGELFGWGATTPSKLLGSVDRLTPYKLDTDGKKVKKLAIATGTRDYNVNTNGHIVAQMEDDTIYTWGSNEYGQLGSGDNANKDTPTLVEIDFLVKDIFVAGGNYGATYVIAQGGDLYVCGENSNGNLGLSHTNNVNLLSKVTNVANIEKVRTSNIYYYATVCIEDADKNLYVSGYNGYGNLGTGDYTNTTTFKKLPIKNVKDFVFMSVDRYSSLAVLTSDNRVMITGANTYYQTAQVNNTKNRSTLSTILF